MSRAQVSFNFGDGSPAVYLLGHVTDINEADDWLEAVSVLTHAYPEPNLRFDGSVIPWEASFSGSVAPLALDVGCALSVLPRSIKRV